MVGARRPVVRDDAGYAVDVKPSARRTNGAVGRAVLESGSRRTFADRPAAEAWAAVLSESGPRVWIRDANPNDSDPVDGYLVGRRSGRPTAPADPTDGSQTTLDDDESA